VADLRKDEFAFSRTHLSRELRPSGRKLSHLPMGALDDTTEIQGRQQVADSLRAIVEG